MLQDSFVAPLPGTLRRGAPEPPPASSPDGRRRRVWEGAALGAWFLYNEVSTAREYASALRGHAAPWWLPAAAAAPSSVLLTLLAGTAFVLSFRFPVGRALPRRHLRVHAGAALVLALAAPLIEAGVAWTVGVDGPRGNGSFAAYLLLYAVLAGFAHGPEYASRSRAQERAALLLRAGVDRAELARSRAQLRTLRLQLSPAFLLGTLRQLQGMVGDDPERAQRLLARLGELLVAALRGAAPDEVSLEEELDAARPYLEVEKTRFGARIEVRRAIDEETLDALVPHVLVQPLLEAVIVEGIAPHGGGEVWIRARRQARHLVLEAEAVPAPSPCAGEPAPHAEPDALAAVRARLRERLGDEGELELRRGAGAGAAVRVRLPGHEEPMPSAPALSAPAAGPAGRTRAGRRLAWAGAAGLACWFLVFMRASYTGAVGSVLAPGYVESPRAALAASFFRALLWTAQLAAAFVLTGRVPIGAKGTRRAIAVHAAAAVGLALCIMGVKVANRLAVGLPLRASLPPDPLPQLVAIAGVYALLAGIAHAVRHARRYRASGLAALRLEARLARAELERSRSELRLLRLQLNPHLLLNVLHSVSALARDDAGRAARVLASLEEMLRLALEGTGTGAEVELAREVQALRAFVEVERARLGEGLRVHWALAPETLRARVPPMILQPLVENAVKHGLSPAGGEGNVWVRARREGRHLLIHVEDDGVGVARAREAVRGGERRSGGIGTANVAARLRELYGDRAGSLLRERAGGGAVAELRLPWSLHPAPAGAPDGGRR